MPSRYRITLTADFVFTVKETIDGAPGATQEDLEEIIDHSWWWISGSTDVLLESSWKLESFEELPSEAD